MAAVTTAVILEPWRIKYVTTSTFFSTICHKVVNQIHNLSFYNLEFQASVLTLLFIFHQDLFSFSSLSVISVVFPACMRLLIFPLAIFILTCDSSSQAFSMMYHIYKLNKQGDNI